MVTEGSLHNTNIFHIMNGSKQFPYKLVKKCTIKHFLQKLLLWGKCGMLIYKANGLNRDNRLSWFKKISNVFGALIAANVALNLHLRHAFQLHHYCATLASSAPFTHVHDVIFIFTSTQVENKSCAKITNYTPFNCKMWISFLEILTCTFFVSFIKGSSLIWCEMQKRDTQLFLVYTQMCNCIIPDVNINFN